MQNKMTRGELRVIADTDHVQCGDAATMANMLLSVMDSDKALSDFATAQTTLGADVESALAGSLHELYLGDDAAPPAPVAVWNGEGLPPVGCMVEYLTGILGKPDSDDNKPENGQNVEVVAHKKYENTGNEVAVATWLNCNGGMRASVFSPRCLQPIRSEADKKRNAAISAIDATCLLVRDASTTAAAIYDAIAAGEIPGVTIK